MHRFIIIGLTLASVAAFISAWRFEVVLDPSNPIIPLGLAFLAGFAMRQAAD